MKTGGRIYNPLDKDQKFSCCDVECVNRVIICKK